MSEHKDWPDGRPNFKTRYRTIMANLEGKTGGTIPCDWFTRDLEIALKNRGIYATLVADGKVMLERKTP